MNQNNKYLGNELKYIKQVLDGEKWSSTEGSWCGKLEREFAKKFCAKYAIAMNSGTAVLHAALVACGVRPGDEVITPGLTVFMDTSAIFHANAIPVYADVSTRDFNILPEDVERKITSKTKAIIAVSLYGHPCKSEELLRIARQYDLTLIVDNAQHTGIHSGDITTYSFENTKHISCGEGGIVLTNNEDYATRMRKLSNHGFKNCTAKEGRTKLNLDEFQNPAYKRHTSVGWNYRMPEFNAAIALAQLERIDELVKKRRNFAKKMIEVFEEIKNDFILPQEHHLDHSYWSLACKTIEGMSWKELRKKIVKETGDGVYGCWSVPYLEPAIVSRNYVKLNPFVYENVFYKKGLCPKAELIQPQIMQFKTNYRNDKIAAKKIKEFKKVFKNND